MPCHHTGYNRHDIDFIFKRENGIINEKKQKQSKQKKRKKEKQVLIEEITVVPLQEGCGCGRYFNRCFKKRIENKHHYH